MHMVRNRWSAEATHTQTQTGVGVYAWLASNNIEVWRSAVLCERTSHVELCTTFLLKRSVFEIHITENVDATIRHPVSCTQETQYTVRLTCEWSHRAGYSNMQVNSHYTILLHVNQMLMRFDDHFWKQVVDRIYEHQPIHLHLLIKNRGDASATLRENREYPGPGFLEVLF